MKLKNIATLIATTAAVAFVSAPLTSTIASAKHVKCYGLNSCKGKCNSCKGKKHEKNTCKGQCAKKMSEKTCSKKGGSTSKPTAENENETNTTGTGS